MIATLNSKGNFQINHLHRFVSGFFIVTPEIRQNLLQLVQMIIPMSYAIDVVLDWQINTHWLKLVKLIGA
jgi:hypothetical protein